MHRPTAALTLALLATLSLAVPARAAGDKTLVNDKTAASMLLGRHMLSLQWVSWDRFGSATVANRGGVYALEGSQRGAGGDFVEIHGVITRVDATEFAFRGKITTRVSHINGGAPCVRDGEFTFAIKGGRKYWRLVQMDNPCDEATDYVDIYFRR